MKTRRVTVSFASSAPGNAGNVVSGQSHAELLNNLSAAAHLIHGSSEGRFPHHLLPGPLTSLEAIRLVGFEAATSVPRSSATIPPG